MASLKKGRYHFKKKTTSYREQDPEKVRQYKDSLEVLSDLPVVYIDETGIDTYLHRSRARAPKGEKVYAQVSGRRFERISIVSGQVGNQFIAPMVYKGSMISDFFVKWFKESLVPSLDRPHLIVMDNASFHPKKILDQLAISNGHIFLPLPPYSPELNPIEKSWANLKKEVAEYLREGKSITDAVSYCLKVK
ncbi:IS630 family transposase [Streptococcus danieliae]|uniref:IS630 family transposase n=1 Tax=Streptococcus danieliae TaxID=747656 RepID=UPI003CF7978B